MRALIPLISGMIVLALTAGCRPGNRMATRVTDVPRVDLELTGGNRGYLVGTPPEAANRKTTRQMVETDIELPSFYKPKPGANPRAEDFAPPETESMATSGDQGAIRVGTGGGPQGPFDSYVVQKGDSLWSIAAKPEVYGRASQWQRLFDANRELLKNDPNRVRAGMTLRIPRGGSDEETAFGDEGSTFAK